jgi:hypothetical protein
MAESRRPLANRSDAELEEAVSALGQQIVFPPTPDVAAAVRMRLEETPAPAPAALSRRRVVWLAAAALLILILGALALFPDMRTAIADRLGLRGVEIHWLDELPTPAPSPNGSSLQLGRSIALDAAKEQVSFPLFVPTAPGFADPSEIYLRG